MPLAMSNQEDPRRPSRRPSRRDEQLREQIVESYGRRCKLDALAVEVLRLIVAESAVRGESGGKFSLRLPSQVTLEQQIKIARPLWKFLRRAGSRRSCNWNASQVSAARWPGSCATRWPIPWSCFRESRPWTAI